MPDLAASINSVADACWIHDPSLNSAVKSKASFSMIYSSLSSNSRSQVFSLVVSWVFNISTNLSGLKLFLLVSVLRSFFGALSRRSCVALEILESKASAFSSVK